LKHRKSTRTPDYERFLRRLKDEREAAGITQAALSKKLERPQSFVSKGESGERRIDVGEFLQWAKALGIDPVVIIQDLLGPPERRYLPIRVVKLVKARERAARLEKENKEG